MEERAVAGPLQIPYRRRNDMYRKRGWLPALLLMVVVPQGALAGSDPVVMATEAKMITMKLLKELGGTLKQEMKARGPAGAISVCKDKAPAIAGRLSRETGWRITRVGTRVRNPMLGMPDAWEQKVLAMFEERRARGEPLKEMAYHEIVEEPGGRYFRFMKALGVKPVCTNCHGDDQAVHGEVKAQLAAHYPHDEARGYKPGDLRGAISIKRPLD